MVEWKKLKDVAVIKNGKDYKKLSNGNIPVYGTGGIMTYVNQFASDKPSVLLPRKGSVENIYYVEEPFWTVDTIYWTDIDVSIIVPKYLYITLQQYNLKEFAYGGARPSLSQQLLYNLDIPIPSLEEQNRIVGILDTFTDSIENLKQQIAQRRKQYEHYRDQLLDLEGKEGVKMKIEEFCFLKAGKSIKAEELSAEYDGSNYPCFGGNGVRGYVSFFSHDGEYPIIGRQGALCGCVNWAYGKFYATEHAVVAKGNNKVNQRFLLHLFQHADLNQYKTQGAQPGLSVAKLNEITFIIPSLQEQQRIVSILDTFEASISNLEAQLEQRQKQYEYYRNKLLSFEKEEQ